MIKLKLVITRAQRHSQVCAATFSQSSPLLAKIDLQIKLCPCTILTMLRKACNRYEGLCLDAKADQ